MRHGWIRYTQGHWQLSIIIIVTASCQDGEFVLLDLTGETHGSANCSQVQFRAQELGVAALRG